MEAEAEAEVEMQDRKKPDGKIQMQDRKNSDGNELRDHCLVWEGKSIPRAKRRFRYLRIL